MAKNTDCYGCGACAVVCPKRAVSISYNDDGFLAPSVDNNCVDCGLCLKVCAFECQKTPDQNLMVNSYAAFSNDSEVRKACSSGGIGYELAKYAIKIGYIFCGVRYNTVTGHAEHYFADSVEALDASRGSKYIQSHMIDAFSKFQKGKKYMAVGTPCQIDSLRRYVRLKKMEDDFILIDFFCHGVPSDLMWQKYVAECGLKDVTDVSWRDKRTGWHDSWNMIFRTQKEELSSLMSKGDFFYKFFLRNRCLGKACYDDCKYKMDSSAADIRIGDLWGTKYQSDEDGISGVITLTQRGEDLLHQLKTCTIIPETLEVVTESQMKKCASRPSSYEYVKDVLKTDATLSEIDKRASRIEFFRDEIPHKIKYYSRRIIEKLLCK